jgi:hypothetical protein
MPSKLVISLFVICYTFFVLITPVYADITPVPGAQTCDLCGWCQPNPKPPTWDSCKQCLYDAAGNAKTTKPYYTVLGCIDANENSFTKAIMQIVFGASGGIAFLYFVYGSILVLTSTGDPIKLQNGKDTITSSVIGIFLIIFSIFLLRVVGYDILRIPGFG